MAEDRSVYLGDIDPNNHIDSVMNIRRQVLFRLLMWESIVLSDSQCLTDPRIHILMGEIGADEICNEYSVSDVDKSMKGFEQLIRSGLVEIAHREEGDSRFEHLWQNMIKKDTKDVPYLPRTDGYARFLDGISHDGRLYSLPSIGNRFRNNLNRGVEDGSFLLGKSNPTDKELRRMFLENTVLFRNILDFIKEMRDKGVISEERYNEIYRYVYGNYSVNISAETGCSITTQFKNVPFHLEPGKNEYCDEMPSNLTDKMRPTWALDPRILDLISFEQFVSIRRALKPVFANGRLTDFYKGQLLPEECPEFLDVWEDFTRTLEWELKNTLYRISFEKMQAEKKAARPVMKILQSSGVSLITGVIGLVFPTAGTVIDTLGVAADAIASGVGGYRYLKRKKTDTPMAEQKKLLEKYVSPDARIITRIDK